MSRPVHLAEVGLSWPPDTFLRWKVEGLAQRGFRVTVATSYEHGPPFSLPGVEVLHMSNGDLEGLRPDIAHFEWESAAVSHLALAERWRCPVVISCHGGLRAYGQLPGYARVLDGLPAVFERAAAVQCVSEAERDEAVRLGLDPAKARLMPCGVDPAVFSPPPPGARSGSTMRLVSVGWLRWVKGYEYALQAMRALLDSGVPARLDVFGGDPLPPLGEPSDRARMLHTIDDLDLGGKVRLHDHVPTHTVIEHLRWGHALLQSSVSEGLPVVILEAMACGLPVVASDCGGVREAVRDGVEGFVVPPREPARAAAALARLWGDPELRERMGRAGTERVRSSFTLDAHLGELEELYREVAGGVAA